MDNTDRGQGYFAGLRGGIDALLPAGTHRLLSIGCASGRTEAMLKERLGLVEVVGVELEPAIAEQARAALDAVHIGDIETLDLPYPAGYFDAILCLDVLEHLRDPWEVLAGKLRPLLAPDGVIIVSVPNVRYWVVLWRLFWGQWGYARRGILDIGHLRFFTPRTARQMLTETGFAVVAIHRKYRLYDSLGDQPGSLLVRGINRLVTNTLNKLYLFDILLPLRDFFTFQIILVGRNSGDRHG